MYYAYIIPGHQKFADKGEKILLVLGNLEFIKRVTFFLFSKKKLSEDSIQLLNKFYGQLDGKLSKTIIPYVYKVNYQNRD